VPLAVLNYITPRLRDSAPVLEYNYSREFKEEGTRLLNLVIVKVNFVVRRLLVTP
jgi:hypothetical protein